MGEAEWCEQPLPEALVERLLAAQHFDQASEHAVAGVVVREPLPGWEQLGRVPERVDVLLEAVVALAVSVKMSPSKPAVWLSS